MTKQASRVRALGGLFVAALAVGIPTALSGTGAAPGSISTVAGTGTGGHTGDGGPAVVAEISHPRGVADMPDGGFVFAEPFNNDVRRVWPNGTITTVAGNGTLGDSGDGGLATSAQLDFVHGVAVLPNGDVLIADERNSRIRRLSADGTITTAAGTGVAGYSGDGGPAALARINDPRGVAALPDGGFVIPDTDNNRVRRVAPDGTITTVAGTGVAGFAGDGGPATAAELDLPFGVAPTADGGFLIADAGNRRVRRVWPDGTITTVAGTGTNGFSGDGGDATKADMTPPIAVAALPDGGFVLADTDNDRVRRVWPDGTITTVAGTGVAGFSGDGGPGVGAELDQPKAVAVTRSGALLVGDSANDRIRLLEPLAPKRPEIVAGHFGRTGRLVRAAFRVCDSTRAPLGAGIRQSRRSRTTFVRRALVSTRGGCRPYRLAWRVPSGSGVVAERLQVRSRAGLVSNAVRGRI